MHWYTWVILGYGIIGCCIASLYSSDIVSLLKRARDQYGPPSDSFCIIGAGIGVFFLMALLWLPLCFYNGLYAAQRPQHLRLNEYRVK